MPVRARIYLLVLLSMTLCRPAQGEEIRDFYSEPGLNPFKETIYQENNEHIDAFSGTLQHKHVDLFIPGSGGRLKGPGLIYFLDKATVQAAAALPLASPPGQPRRIGPIQLGMGAGRSQPGGLPSRSWSASGRSPNLLPPEPPLSQEGA